jgi:hypothetical protein
VFGDTVNTCSRHESTGEPGKIHCSKTTKVQLEMIHRSICQDKKHFSMQERGLVNMKGKGKQLTYWVTGTEDNNLVNTEALAKLDMEVKALLAKADFDSQLRTIDDAGLISSSTKPAVPLWASTSTTASSASSIASSSSSCSASPILATKPSVEVINQEPESTVRRKEKSKTNALFESRIRHPLAAPSQQSHEETVVLRH